MARKRNRIGPYSRRGALAKIDGRSPEALLIKRVVADLNAHVGGQPSVTERSLILRAAWLSLRVAQLDEKIAAGEFTDHDSNSYLAWSNSLVRVLALLGMKGAGERPPSLAEVLAQDAAA
jgi:hypothetical protein